MQFNFGKVFLFILSMTLSGEILADSEWPSKELQQELVPTFGNISVDRFQEIYAQQQLFLTSVPWKISLRRGVVDNRAYLIALSIEFYNSMSPDEMPVNIMQRDGNGQLMPLRPLKAQMRENYMGLIEPVPQALRQSDWDNALRVLTRDELHSYAVEWIYLYHYINDLIVSSRMVIDAGDAPPSVDLHEIDLLNPTYYAVLRDYITKMKPAIDAGIPPWKAEAYLANYSVPRHEPASVAQSVTENPGTGTENYLPNIMDVFKQESHWAWYVLMFGIVIGLLGVVTGILTAVLVCRKKQHR